MEIEVGRLPKQLQKKGIDGRLAKICIRNNIVFLAIFGSYVRRQQSKKSDLDIVIEFDKSKPKSLLDLIRVENELTKVFDRKVDLGILSSLSPYPVEDVTREMRVIYEKR